MGDQTNSFSHPSALLREKGRKGHKRAEGLERQRDDALPFMTFYDVLCPLVPEKEWVARGTKAERAQGS